MLTRNSLSEVLLRIDRAANDIVTNIVAGHMHVCFATSSGKTIFLCSSQNQGGRDTDKNNNTKVYFVETFLFHELKYCICRVISY